MNSFATHPFQISKIVLCVKVRKHFGERIHQNRPSHGLVIHLEGSKRYRFSDGGEFTVTEGDVFYLPKGSSYTVDDIIPGECIAVNFLLQDTSTTFRHFKVSSGRGRAHLPLFEQMLRLWQMQDACSLNLAIGLLYQLIYGVQKDLEVGYLPSSEVKIASACAASIAEGLSEPALTVESLAANAGMSPEYLRRIFGKVYGVSPRKYIISRRMEKAKELLRSGEFKLAEIAELCGFESASYFCRRFKNETGITPSEFAKK